MVSLYSLQNLYNQGILYYVPTELASGPNVSSLNGMQNPYLNMAAQGNLYQTAGMTPDSFSHNNRQWPHRDKLCLTKRQSVWNRRRPYRYLWLPDYRK